jgi:NAD(P)-dependent dehydrogenase (short-subunit alcohol dehydrogenase family)
VAKRVVLISGAAGGIGRATVDRFLASGYEVRGIDLDPAVESRRGESYRGLRADVRVSDQVRSAIEELVGDLSLAHVVALAGGFLDEEKRLLDERMDDAVEAFRASVELNLTGQFILAFAALPRLREAAGDRSITLCSTLNALGGFGGPAYSAAKAGLIGMMHSLAAPLGVQGIRVNVVAPGIIRTPPVERQAKDYGEAKIFERVGRTIPLRRVGMPDDVATAIEAVAHRMTYVTDDVVRVDGGRLLAREPPRRFDRLRMRMRRRLRHPPGLGRRTGD